MKKINWGTGIVIAFVLFIGFILFFVIKTSTDTNYDYDMVADDYYNDELQYQEQIDKLENTKTDKVELVFTKIPEGIKIEFPSNLNYNDITGTVSLYRPSNQVLDFEMPLSISKNSLLIPKKVLIGGRWDIHVEWNYKSKKYLSNYSINF